MINEYFADSNAVIGRLDPRLKIVFAAAYSFCVALLKNFEPLVFSIFISFLLLSLAGVRFRILAGRLLAFNAMVLLFWGVLPFTFSGEALFQLGPLTATRPGVLLAALITLKANAIITAFIALVSTTPVSVMGHALLKLRIPQKIVHILLLTYRYVFVIEQEYERLSRAMRTRGFIPKTNTHTYRSYAYLVGMIFVRSLDRAQRVHQAMICRGFDGNFYSLNHFKFKTADYVVSPLMATALIGLEAMEWISIL